MSYQIILEFEARGKLATLILDTPLWVHMGVLGLMEHGIHSEKNLHDPNIQHPMSHPPLLKKQRKENFQHWPEETEIQSG